MKKKNIKPLVLSSLAALSLGSLSVAGTFALFTDKAETTVQIGAGTIDVNQEVSILSVKELNDVTVSAASDIYTNSVGSKTYLDADNPGLLHLEKWVPGDKVTLRIVNKNASNVKIKTRFLESHTNTSGTNIDLYNALTFNYSVKDAENNDIKYKYMEWTVVDPSVTTISTVDVTIEFPNHDEGILANNAGIDNTYQGKSCDIVFTQEAVQANASVNSILLQINNSLDAARATEGANVTMSDALLNTGVSVSTIKNAGYVWNALDDQFYYPQEATENMYHFFKIYDAMPDTQTYSIYADSWNSIADIDLDGVGFDAGNSTGILTVDYVDTVDSVGRENYIRTNSSATAITIDAAMDVVHHYGTAGSLNIIAVAGSSYHEHGKVAFVEIAKGRIALEKEAKIEKIHINAKENPAAEEEKFEKVTIAKEPTVSMPELSRDSVEISPTGTLVVELQDSLDQQEAQSNFVWLTKQGIYEQIAVSDNDQSSVSSGETAVKYADEVESTETQLAAQQIANNIGRDANSGEINATVSIGNETYDLGLDEDRNIVLLNTPAEPDEEPEIVYTVEIKENGDTVIKDVAGAEVVNQELAESVSSAVNVKIKDTGLNAQDKEEIKSQVVEEAISVDVAEEDDDFVCRIGLQGYPTFSAAMNDAKNMENATISMLKDAVIDYANYAVNTNVVVDLRNTTLTHNTTKKITINNGASLTFRNGELNLSNGLFTFNNDVDLTFDNVDLVISPYLSGTDLVQLYGKTNVDVLFNESSINFNGAYDAKVRLFALNGSDNNCHVDFRKANLNTENLDLGAISTGCSTSSVTFDQYSIDVKDYWRIAPGGSSVQISRTEENKVIAFTATAKELWTDAVVAAPSDYVVDGNGNIEIGSAEALAWFAKQASSSNFANKTVKLTKDIDLSNRTWTPINCAYGGHFAGTFDGQGHNIDNIRTVDQSYGNGLFYSVVGSVKNLNVRYSRIGYASGNVVGVVAGYTYGNVSFENVHVNSCVINGYGKVGGLVGMAAEPGASVTAFKNCSAESIYIYGYYNIAGILGNAQNVVDMDAEVCIKDVSVKLNTTASFQTVENALVTRNNDYHAEGSCDLDDATVSGIYWMYSSSDIFMAYADFYCGYDDFQHDVTIGENTYNADGVVMKNAARTDENGYKYPF